MRQFRLITLAFMAICFFLFFYYGFAAEQPCDLDKQYLWCHLHPLKTMAVIGIILFIGGCLAFGQAWTYLWPDMDDEQPGKTIVLTGFLAAAAGFILIWLS